MESEQRAKADWVNLPERTSTVSLWPTLHDGDLFAIESDLLARTVTLRFDVGYVRDFHHLPEQTRFGVTIDGVQSVRALRSVSWPGEFSVPAGVNREEESRLIAEYHFKWREESQGWSDFEQLTRVGLEVSDATLARGSDELALSLGLLVENNSYAKAQIRGHGITFHADEKRLTLEEFLSLGEAYWSAFAGKV